MFNFQSLNGDVGFVTKYVNAKLSSTSVYVRNKIAEAAIKCCIGQTDYTPYNIVDMVADASAWYAMDKYHCYSDTSCTVLATIGGTVGGIKSSLPNALSANVTATQSTVSKQAVLQSNGLTFSRSANGGYSVDLGWLAGENYYVVLVVEARTNYLAMMGNYSLFGGQTDQLNKQLGLHFRSDGQLVDYRFNNSLVSTVAPTYTSSAFSIDIVQLKVPTPSRTLYRDNVLLASTTATSGNPSAAQLSANTGAIIGNTNSNYLKTNISNGNNLGTAFDGIILDVWVWAGSVSVYSDWDVNTLGRFFNYYRNLKIPALM